MEKSLFKDVPESLFEDYPNVNPEPPDEDFEEIGDVSGTQSTCQSPYVHGTYWSNVTAICNSTKLTGRLNNSLFTLSITGLQASDIAVGTLRTISGTNLSRLIPESGWTITVSGSTVPPRGYVTVTAEPSDNRNIWNSYMFGLLPNTVMVGTEVYPQRISSGVARGQSSSVQVTNEPYWSTPTSGNNTITAVLNFRYKAAVSGITASDFYVRQIFGEIRSGGWSIKVSSSTASVNGSITVTATAPNDIAGRYVIAMEPNSVRIGTTSPALTGPSDQGLGQGVWTSRVSIDTTAYWSHTTQGTTLTARLNFRYSENVSGISASDFTLERSGGFLGIHDSFPNRRSDWTISVSSSTATGRGYVTVTATPPNRIHNSYWFDFNTNSIRIGSTTTNNAPRTSISSRAGLINNNPYFSDRGSTSSRISVTLHSRYTVSATGVTVSDFAILEIPGHGQNAVDPRLFQTGWTIQISSNTLTAGGSINITAYPPRDAYGRYRVALKPFALDIQTSPRLQFPTRDNYIFSSYTRIRTGAYWSNLSGGSTLSGRINFPWPHSVSGITASDFTIFNSRYSSVTGWSITVSSSTAVARTGFITVTATPPIDTNATFRIRLKANSGTSNSVSIPSRFVDSSLVQVTRSAPTVVVAIATWFGMVGGNSLFGQLRFSGASITGLSTSDIEILNSSNVVQSGWTLRVGSSSVSNGSNSTVRGTPPLDTRGSFKFRVKARSVRSSGSSSNNSPSSAVTSPSVSIYPAISSVSWSRETGGTTLSARATISIPSAAISGITTSDFEIVNPGNTVQSNWSISLNSSTLTSHGWVTLTATPPAQTNGSFRIRIKARSFKSGGSTIDNAPSRIVTSSAVAINNVVAAVARAEWSDVQFDRVDTANDVFRGISGRINFRGASVAGINSRDFEVLNASGVIQTKRTRDLSTGVITPGWQIFVSSASAASGSYVTVEAAAPDNTKGSYGLRLKALSLRSGGSVATDNAPIANVDSIVVSVDNTGTIPNIFWSSVSGGRTLVAVITFSNAAVERLSSGAFNILNNSDQIQSGWEFDVPSTSASSGSSVTITCTPPDNTNDEFRIQLRALALRSGGSVRRNAPIAAINSSSVIVDNVSVGRARMSWTSITGGLELIGILQFTGARVSGITASDFRVLSRNNVNQTGWNITVSHNSRNIGESVTVTAVAPSNTNGFYRLQVRAFSIISGGRSTRSTPTRSIYTVARSVNNIPNVIANGSWSSVLGGETISGNITFSGARVWGIRGTDFEVLNNNDEVQSNWSISISNTQAAIGGTINVSAAPDGIVNGSFKLRLKALSIQSDRSSTNNAPTSAITSQSVTVDNDIVIATAEWINVLGGRGSLLGFLQFSGASVEGIEPADFQVLQVSDRSPVDIVQTDWSIHVSASSAIAGNTVIITATPPSNLNGRFYLKLLKTSVKSDRSTVDNAPLNDVSSLSRAVDNRQIIVAGATWNSITGGTTLIGKLSFTGTFASSISSNAFRVQNSRGIDQTDWSITVSHSIANAGTEITVTATPSGNKRGAFRLQLRAQSVKSGGSRTFNAPSSTVTSAYVSFDNIPARIATATWKTITGGTSLTGTITFHIAIVLGIQAGDFEVLNSSNTVQTGWTITVSSSTALPETVITPDGDVRPGPLPTPITVTANPPASTNGSFKIRLKATSVMSDGSPTNNAPASAVVSSAATVNNSVTPVSNITWSNETGGRTLEARLTFDTIDVAFLGAESFQVVDVNGTTYNWVISHPQQIVNNRVQVTVRARPPTGTTINGSFGFILKKLSLKLNRSLDFNAPLEALASDLVIVDTSAPVVSDGAIQWSNVTGGTTLSATCTFLEGASDIEVSDFFVTDANQAEYPWRIVINNTERLVSLSTSPGGEARLVATPPGNVNGLFGFGIRANSVMSGPTRFTTRVRNAPRNTLYSGTASVNNTGENPKGTYRIASADWSNTGGDVVRVYYARPDGVESWSITDTIRTQIRNFVNAAQNFYADQMELQGYGRQTFNTVTDANGDLEILEVNIRNIPNGQLAQEEAVRATKLVHPGATSVIFSYRNILRQFAGIASDRLRYAFMDGDGWNSGTTAHEIGHTVGLIHADGGTDRSNIMYSFAVNDVQYGKLSTTSARKINASRRFGDQSQALTVSDASIVAHLTFFGADINDLEPTDIEVINATTNMVDYDWEITFSRTSIPANQTTIVTATPQRAKNGSFKLRLKALSVKSDLSPRDNSPLVATDSDEISLISNDYITVDSFNAPGGLQSETYSRFVLKLSDDIPIANVARGTQDQITASDFIVPNNTSIFQISYPIISTITGVSDEFYIFVKNPENSNGTYAITFKADSIPASDTYLSSPQQNAISSVVIYDTKDYTAYWERARVFRNNLIAELSFKQLSVLIETSDFEVIKEADDPNDPPIVQTGWTKLTPVVQSKDLGTLGSEITVATDGLILVRATVPSSQNGNFALRLKSNTIKLGGSTTNNSPPMDTDTNFVAIDNTGPTVAIATWGSLAGGATLRSRLRINTPNVTRLTTHDIEVIDSSDVVQTGWTIAGTVGRNPNVYIDIVATPPDPEPYTNADFKLRLPALSFGFGTSAVDNSPASAAVTATAETVDNREQLSISSFNAPMGNQRRANSTFKLTLDRAVPRTELTAANPADFSVQTGTTGSIQEVKVTEVTGSNSDKYDIIVRNPVNMTGTYFITIATNAVSGTDKYKPGPTILAQRNSGSVTFDTRASGITARWGAVTVNPTTRRTTSSLIFSVDPGTSFNAGEDIRVQKRSGSVGSYTWTTEAVDSWEITTCPTSSTTKPITADPSPSVDAGTYRFLLLTGALGSGSGGQTSNDFTIGDDMAIPTATINYGSQQVGSSVRFLVTWSSVNDMQLSQFTSSDVQAKDASTGAIISGTTSTVVSAGTGSNAFHVTVTGFPSNSMGEFYIFIPRNAIANSYSATSVNATYSTVAAVVPVTFSFVNVWTAASGGTTTTDYDRDSIYVQIDSGGRSISDFTESDILVSGACSDGLTPSSGSHSSWRLKLDITDNTKGTITVFIHQNSVSAGNLPQQVSYNYDRTSTSVTEDPATITFGTPKAAATGNANAASSGGKITAPTMHIPITFSKQVTGFTESDIFVNNGCKAGLTPSTSTGTEWRLGVSNLAQFDGLVTVGVFTGVTTSSGSNVANSMNYAVKRGGPASTPNPLTFRIGNAYKNIDPTISPNPTLTPPLSDATVHIDIAVFPRAVASDTDFTISDISVSGGYPSSLYRVPSQLNRRWSLVCTIPDDEVGTLTVYIPPNVVSDGNASATRSFQFRTRTAPHGAREVEIDEPYTLSRAGTQITGEINRTNNPTLSFYVPIDFGTGSNVEGFTKSDIWVSTCKGELIKISDTLWRIQVDPDDDFDGWITVTVPENVITNSGGNIAASRTLKVDYSQARPSGTPTSFSILNAYDSATGGSSIYNPSASSPAPITVPTFYVHIRSSLAVADFTGSDITVAGGCQGDLTELTGTGITDNTQWRLEVSAVRNTAGVVSITIPPNVVNIGNENVSEEFEYNYIVQVPDPVRSFIGSAYSSATGSGTLSGEITDGEFWVLISFDDPGSGRAITGFSSSDVVVNNACKGGITVHGTTGRAWRLHIDNEDNFRGIVTITVPTDIIRQGSTDGGNYAATKNFNVDTTSTANPTTFRIIGAYAANSGGSPLTQPFDNPTVHIEIESTLSVSDFTDTDITVSGGCKGTLNPITPGTRWRIAISTIYDTAGFITVTIPPNIVSIGNNQVSEEFEYNRVVTIPDPVSSFIGAAYSSSTGSGTISGTIDESEFWVLISFGDPGSGRSITGFSASDVVVNNACKGGITVHGTTGRAWRLHIDNLDDFKGVVTVTVPTDIIRQGSTDGGNYAATKNFNVDTTPTANPTTFRILNAYAANSGGSPLTQPFDNPTVHIEIESTLSVLDFTDSDIDISGGCKGTLNTLQTGRRWRIAVSTVPNTAGVITVAIQKDIVSIGNNNVSEEFEYGRLVIVSPPVSSFIGAAYTSSTGSGTLSGTITAGEFWVLISFDDPGSGRSITGFSSSDVVVNNACKGGITVHGTTGRAWRLHIDNEDNFKGVVTITVPTNIITQGNSGGNLASTKNFNVNTIPTASPSTVFNIGGVYAANSGGSPLSQPFNNSTVHIEITSTESVSDFTSSSVDISGGCKGTLDPIQTGRRWRIAVSTVPDTAGVITVGIQANIVSIGNNKISKDFEYSRISMVPQAVRSFIGAAYTSVSGSSIAPDPITAGEFWVSVSFDDPGSGRAITGFSASDIVVNNACKGSLTPFGTTGRAWRLHINNESEFKGVVTITILTDSIRQGSTRGENYASTKNFNVNTIPDPEVVVPVDETVFTIGDAYASSAGTTSVTDGNAIERDRENVFIKITSTDSDGNENSVSDFTDSDINISGGCIVGLTPSSGSAHTWYLNVAIPNNSSGYLIITILEDSVSVGNKLKTKTFSYDRSGNPYLEITNLPTDEVTGNIVTLTIVSKLDGEQVNIDDLTNEDIIVTSDDNEVQHNLSAT